MEISRHMKGYFQATLENPEIAGKIEEKNNMNLYIPYTMKNNSQTLYKSKYISQIHYCAKVHMI